MKYRFAVILVLIFSCLGLLVCQYFTFHDGKLHVVFCNVGQGDGIFIRTPGRSDILVDAGPDDSILSCLSRHMPLWDRSIELAFATHPDADHITGFEYVLKNYKVGVFNTSEKTNDTQVFKTIQNLIKEKNVPEKFIFSGDTYKISDGVVVKDFWPTQQYVASANIDSDTNSFSLVQTLQYGNFKVLLAGDIEREILDNIFKNGLTVDVFKLSHHGSKTGTDDLTFQKVKSKFDVLSVGFKNRYHHPSPEILALLKKYNISFERTDRVGDIEVITDGNSMTIRKL